MCQYEHCTVWQHSWCCPLCGLVVFIAPKIKVVFSILAALTHCHSYPPLSLSHKPSWNIIHLYSETLCTAALCCNSCSDIFSCSISRQTQLFLKLEDFFWREHLSNLALPYGIKSSGMLTLHCPLLFMLSLLSMSHILVLLVVVWRFHMFFHIFTYFYGSGLQN